MMTDSSTHNLVAPHAAIRRHWRLPVLLLAIIISIFAGGIWLLASTSGLRWLAATVAHTSANSVSFEGVSGTLINAMGTKTLVINSGDLRITARDIQLDWRPAALLKGRLEVSALTVQEVEVLSRPDPLANKLLPQNLRLPLSVDVSKLDIVVLRVLSKEGGAPDFTVNKLTARLESDGLRHQLHNLHASLKFGELTASGQLDGIKPFALQAQASLTGLANYIVPEAKNANISFTATGNLERLTVQAKGSGAGLSGEGEAQWLPYATFPLAALRLSARGLDPRAFSPDAPKASLTLQTDLISVATGQLVGDVSVGNAAPASYDHEGLPLTKALVHMNFSSDLLQFDKLKLLLSGGGIIAGRFAWQRDQAAGSSDLTISHLDPAALDTRLRTALLNGRMKISGGKFAQQGVVTLSDSTLRLDAHLTRAGKNIFMDNLRLSRGQSAFTGQGKLEFDGRRSFNFNGKLQHFDFAAFLHAPRSDLNATLELTGKLEPQTTGTVNFQISDSRLEDQPVTGYGRIEYAGINDIKGETDLRLGNNSLSAKGGLGTVKNQLQMDLVAPALAQLGSGYGGSLNAHISLTGSLASPEAIFEAEGHDLALPGDHHLSSLTAAASLHGEGLTLNIKATGYRINAESPSSISFIKGFQNLQIAVNGTRSQHELQVETRFSDDLNMTLRASGGIKTSENNWRDDQWLGKLSELSVVGRLPLRLLAATPLTLGREHISLGAAKFAVAGGQADISDAEWTPQSWNSRGSFTGIGLRAGVDLHPDIISEEGQPALRLGGEWNIASAASLVGSLRVARESGDWVLPGDSSLALGLRTLQFSAHAAEGQLTGELTAQGERFGDMRASVAMPLARSDSGWTIVSSAPLTGKLLINLADLGWVGPVLNSNLKSGGRLSLDADVTNTIGAPRLRGQVRGDDLALAFLDQGVRLQQGHLAARFDQDVLHIDTLSFTSPHEQPPRDRLLAGLNLAPEVGSITAFGAIDLTGKNGDLPITASHLPLTQRKDRWIIASGNGRANLDKNKLILNGNITADAGLISQPVAGRPQLSDDVLFTGQQSLVRNGQYIAVDAVLDLGKHFYLRASGLEARLAGQLHLRGEPGQSLRVTGTIEANEASFEAYGQHLTVERGIVNFQGPLEDPGLNILALRKDLPVEAGVEVTGTVRRPVVKLVSTPTVPDSEKLSWIVLGHAPDAGGSDAPMLIAAAGSILGGQSGGITSQLTQALGVDEFSIRQAGNSSQNVYGTPLTPQNVNGTPLTNQIATIGKRLSARASISYEQGVSAAAGVTKLTYTLTPRINIVTQAGADNAIDVFYTFSFK